MKMNHKLKMLLDLGPLGVFFLAFRFSPYADEKDKIFAATIAIMAATLIALAVTYWIEKKIAVMPLVSGGIIAVFGSLTLLLHDDTFIKMKPTLVNLIFASILLVGLFLRKSLLKHVMGSALTITDAGWRLLTIRWMLFFIFLAALNELIWRNFPTDFWVNFKVFGMFSLTIIFTLCQLPLIKKYHKE